VSRKKAFHAGVWSSADLTVRLGIHFVVSILLARILTPTDFGIFALIMFFIAISQILVDRGFATVIVQRYVESEEEKTAIFWYTIILSVLIALTMFVIAPWFANFFGHPVLQPLLYLSATIVPLNALASVPTALLQRELRFDVIAKSGLTASILSGCTAVIAAFLGAGVWSFAIQAALYSVLNSALIWGMGRWSPLRRMHLAQGRKLVGFGSFVTMAGLLDVLYIHGSSLLIGRLHGVADLGLYNRAQNLQNLPGGILAAIVNRVALPLFAKMEDSLALQDHMRIVQGAIMLINLPLMAALIVLPDLLIEVLYGPKWLFAAPILAILAFGGILFPLQMVNMQVVLSQGRSGTMFKVEVAKKLIGLALLVIGSLYGLTGLAIGQATSVYIGFIINAVVSGRVIGYGLVGQVRDLTGVVLITAIMAAVLAFTRPMLPFSGFYNMLLLALVGSAVFTLSAIAFRVGVISQLLAMTPLGRFFR